MDDLQKQLDELRVRVARLERQQWLGPPRLGPGQPTEEEKAAQTKKLGEVLVKAAEAMDFLPRD